MDYYEYPQYLYILAILAISSQTHQDLVSLKESTEIWPGLAKILSALQTVKLFSWQDLTSFAKIIDILAKIDQTFLN